MKSTKGLLMRELVRGEEMIGEKDEEYRVEM